MKAALYLRSSKDRSDISPAAQRHALEQLYTVVYAAQDGPTGGRQPEGWSLTFAALDEPKESVVAETRKVVADADLDVAGLIGPHDDALRAGQPRRSVTGRTRVSNRIGRVIGLRHGVQKFHRSYPYARNFNL